MNKNLWLALLITFGIVTGCTTSSNINTPVTKETTVSGTDKNQIKNSDSDDTKLLTFNSCTDLESTLKEHFETAQKKQKLQYKNFAMPSMMRGGEPEIMMDNAIAVNSIAEESGGGASDKFSGTNIQEFGVDEADIIKNDGEYIYMIRKNSVRIIKTNNGKLEAIANFEVKKEGFYPREMYVDGDLLTLIGNASETIDAPKLEPQIIDDAESGVAVDVAEEAISVSKRIAPGFAPGEYYPSYNRYKQMTVAATFDISDRANPKQTRMVSVEGNYQSSRKIGGVVYLVSNKYQDNYWNRPMPIIPFEMPIFRDSNFASETIVSECGNVNYMPHFETPNYLIIAAIDTTDNNKKVGRKMILGSGNQIYASTKNLYVTKNKYWYGWGSKNTPTTDIYKFGLNGTEINFKTKGEVTGTVLNQFSMSEDAKGFFRIATQENNKGARMSILDKNLKLTGAIKNIAPGENIKSVRFMDDKAYMITFKNVDPLFVIDLNPTTPKVLGKLKIPGWSDYLHPFKENYLIGIGKEVSPEAEAKKRLTSSDVLGVKLAIFDVSDLTNPKEVWKTVIGDQGSYTEVLNNHKALLFDAKENILALPITVQQKDGAKRNNWQPTKTVFKGAMVYDLSIENGFTLKGKATHYNQNYWETNDRNYGNHEFDIQRIIFIGDNFYTIAPNTIASHSWNEIEKKQQIQLDQKACEEIYEAMECRLQTKCNTVQKEWEECSVDNENFSKTCKPKTQFLKCVSK